MPKRILLDDDPDWKPTTGAAALYKPRNASKRAKKVIWFEEEFDDDEDGDGTRHVDANAADVSYHAQLTPVVWPPSASIHSTSTPPSAPSPALSPYSATTILPNTTFYGTNAADTTSPHPIPFSFSALFFSTADFGSKTTPIDVDDSKEELINKLKQDLINKAKKLKSKLCDTEQKLADAVKMRIDSEQKLYDAEQKLAAAEKNRADAEKEWKEKYFEEVGKNTAKRIEELMLARMTPYPDFSYRSQCSMIKLDIMDPLYIGIASSFLESARNRHRGPRSGDPHRDMPKLEIVSIERNYNKRLWNKFAAERDDIAGICDNKVSYTIRDDLLVAHSSYLPALNDFFLYHGVKHDLVERIALQGFDERYAGEHFGKLFGSGVYFAKNASKSDIYTTPDLNGNRSIFLSRVCLGETHTTTVSMSTVNRPPERVDKRGPKNSVRAEIMSNGGCVEFLEYIIYRGTQAYPEYCITYKHQPGCACTHCCK